MKTLSDGSVEFLNCMALKVCKSIVTEMSVRTAGFETAVQTALLDSQLAKYGLDESLKWSAEDAEPSLRALHDELGDRIPLPSKSCAK